MEQLKLPDCWASVLSSELDKPYFHQLQQTLDKEEKSYTIYPPRQEIFSALELTPYTKVNVLLLGQDPYHGENQAHGLCFSVKPGIKPPPSLANMFIELQDDLGYPIPNNGYLVPWAKQGILMLNAVLTVRAGSPNSHKDIGWERFTDTIISKVNDKDSAVVFVLWGSYAHKKLKLINTNRHTVIQSAHPSPLSAYRGFLGSKPYSKINNALRKAGKPEIDWQIPNLQFPKSQDSSANNFLELQLPLL